MARYNLRLLDSFIRTAIKDRVLLAQWRTIRRVAVTATSVKSLDEAAGSAANPGTTQLPATSGGTVPALEGPGPVTTPPVAGTPEVLAAA